MPKYIFNQNRNVAFSATLKTMERVQINPVLSFTEDKESGTLEVEGEEGNRLFQFADLYQHAFINLSAPN